MDNAAVFLDRDGTVNEDVGYLDDVDRVALIDCAAEAIALLRRNGLKAIVVTNQSGVARGYFSEELLPRLHDKLQRLLKEQGAGLDAIYYCPHHPDDHCDCRKPKLGMIRRAEKEFSIDPSRSYVVGDKLSDVEFGRLAGCKAILVRTGHGKDELANGGDEPKGEPDYIAEDILDAAKWIVRDLQAQRPASP